MPNEYAALSRDPVAVTVAGTRILLPYRPAAVWIQGMGHVGRLVTVLADDPARETFTDLVLDHPGAVADMRDESLRILAEYGGRKWWEVARLLNTSMDQETLGRLVMAGADPWSRSVGEWVAAVYALCLKGQDEKGRLRFEFRLSIPPAGYEDEWDDVGDDPAVAAAQVNAMLKRN